MLKFKKDYDDDYTLQLEYNGIRNLLKSSIQMTEEEKSSAANELKRVNNILLDSYTRLNTVWKYPIFNDHNILFPMYDEITSNRLLNKFTLANNMDSDPINYPRVTPGSMYVYERVIKELLINKDRTDDETERNKIIANLLILGWNPEIDITPEVKTKAREQLGTTLTNEMNESCYFINCTNIVPIFQGDVGSNGNRFIYTKNKFSDGRNFFTGYINNDSPSLNTVHPYYILTAIDNNWSIYHIFKDRIDDLSSVLKEYTGNISIYLFFGKDFEDYDNWRSDEYNMVAKTHPKYSYFINNLMVARMVKSFKDVSNAIDLPIIVKLIVDNKNPNDINIDEIYKFANYCIYTTDTTDIILHNNSHIISPSAYNTSCMSTIMED